MVYCLRVFNPFSTRPVSGSEIRIQRTTLSMPQTQLSMIFRKSREIRIVLQFTQLDLWIHTRGNRNDVNRSTVPKSNMRLSSAQPSTCKSSSPLIMSISAKYLVRFVRNLRVFSRLYDRHSAKFPDWNMMRRYNADVLYFLGYLAIAKSWPTKTFMSANQFAG